MTSRPPPPRRTTPAPPTARPRLTAAAKAAMIRRIADQDHEVLDALADWDRGIVPAGMAGPPPDLTWVWLNRPATLDEVTGCVGPGWRVLVAELVTDLVGLGWDGRIVQVKQKFGELRFYIDGDAANRADLQRRIDVTVSASAVVCDVCGTRGSIRPVSPDGVRATCDEHARVPNRDVPVIVPEPSGA